MSLSVRFHSPYLQAFSNDSLPLMLSAMGTAQSNLDLCLDHLSVEAVVAHAAHLRARGVQVRLLVDQSGASREQVSEVERWLARYGFRKQLDWKFYRGNRPFLNQRFIIMDNRRILTGSTRLTREGIYLQDNVDVVIDSPVIGGAFKRAMDAYWSDCSPHKDKAGDDFWPEIVESIEDVSVGPEQRVSAYFTPYDGNIPLEKLIELIGQAEEAIHFALPEIPHPQLIEALEEQAAAGVVIKGVLDARSARPEHFSYAPKLRALLFTGKIRAMRSSLKNGRALSDTMAVRLLTADHRWTYIGSSDFRPGSSMTRAENALVVDSGSIARQCISFVEALFELARKGGHTAQECRSYHLYKGISLDPPAVSSAPKRRSVPAREKTSKLKKPVKLAKKKKAKAAPKSQRRKKTSVASKPSRKPVRKVSSIRSARAKRKSTGRLAAA